MLSSTRHYYSTQPFLAWCIGHYFAARVHFSWVGFPFHPYKRDNPQSSDPYLLYARLYGPWYDHDPYDHHVTGLRIALERGVQSLRLHWRTKSRLKRCCHLVDLALFLPIVYRVDVTGIAPARLERDVGSGSTGSDEYLIRDLAEGEFDVLFADECAVDPDVHALAQGSMSPAEALRVLERRC